MNRLGLTLAVIAVVATAAWAYHVNYRTKTALGLVDQLRGQIASEREAVAVLRVEWAYLNAPERLAHLVKMNNDRLSLESMTPLAFDEVAEIPFRPRPQEQDIGDAAPIIDLEAILVVTERNSMVVDRVPMPSPRPVGWRLE